MTNKTNYPQLPSFGGEASSFANYGEQVISRNQIPTIEPSKRAADLLLHMADIARKARMTVGKDHIKKSMGLRRFLNPSGKICA